MILFFASLALLILYAFLIAFYDKGWRTLSSFSEADVENATPSIKISVIVPARNEEQNIGWCLESIVGQNYPKELFEVIVINDHSTDNTERIVSGYSTQNVKLINLVDYVEAGLNSYKKKAIEIGISKSSGYLILTTDADCFADKNWLRSIAAYQEKTQAVLIAAPVKIILKTGLLSYFQSLDFLILQGITGASIHRRFHSMCNGANLAYLKSAFYEVNGFKNVDNIASGDDMLLMHKIVTRYPDKFFFLKSREAIVSTQPATSWKEFFNQRIRWASKADKYDDKRITKVLFLVYFLNLFLLLTLVYTVCNIAFFSYFIFLILTKTIIEYAFVSRIANFFSLNKLMYYFLPLQPIHIVYTVIAGFLGKFGKYEWKGRVVK
ncbi:glycosyltransferase [Pinibacter soli]|uniref:Glycosyltransferase n=1 Tax=Pinibacter soli TaxID=3044211 RepID=A0ABT6R7Y1_9BACT|nr:glycosyltransferase [Pinibacter soli]MDI3318668.1 glycosyltransferase [Pinibacter soli]